MTKYKSRRRAAELKLEAAQQNLTRIDDIIYEVEKQRGALKRQAARARRYKRLREELRRWEQVQLAHRYEALAREIEAADARLADARAREAAAAAHLTELDAALETVRLGLTEAEAGATAAREEAHGFELEIGRSQQRIQFERQQIDELARQAAAFAAEAADLDGPSRARTTGARRAARRGWTVAGGARGRAPARRGLRDRLPAGRGRGAGRRAAGGLDARSGPRLDEHPLGAPSGPRERGRGARPRRGRARAARDRVTRAHGRSRTRPRRACARGRRRWRKCRPRS